MLIARAIGIEDLMDTKPSSRVERLREKWFTYKKSINTERIRIYTGTFKKTEGEPREIRLAKAFAAVARQIPTNIYPDELIVGNKDVVPRGCGIFTDYDGPVMEQELDGLQDRPLGEKYEISEEDERLLKEEIFPYWRGEDGTYPQSVYRWLNTLWDDEMKQVMYPDPDEYPPTAELGIVSFHKRGEADVGHINTPPLLIEKGLLGLKKMAEESLSKVMKMEEDGFEVIKKIHFLRGVIIALDGASEIGKRYADEARKLAKEADGQRKVELEKIAEVCDRVPANPPRTFQEAIQMAWFYKVLNRIESHDIANGFGRIDQWLWPYYEKDIKEGRLTKAEAQELLDCWFLKIAEGDYFYSNHIVEWAQGAHPFQIVTIGGVKSDGFDATNELSYMAIDAFLHTRLFQPTIAIRLHSQTPEDFMIKSAKLVALGTGNPTFMNDECVIPSLLGLPQGDNDAPLTLEVAREYAPVGCTEPWVPDHPGFAIHSYLNAAACLDLALNNGVSRVHNRRVGLETGDPRKFKTIEEVKEAYEKQVRYFTDIAIRGSNIGEYTEAEQMPTLLQSSVLRGCIESGLPKERGGARYNYGGPGVQIGMADVGDSLAAIQKVVFEDKNATIGEVIDSIDANFEGYEELRKKLLDAPKFGNDDDYADLLTRWAFDVYADESRKNKNPRGGCYLGGSTTISSNMPFGQAVGALPNGRKAHEPLADGNSPFFGMDRKGPTAVFNSQGKLDHIKQSCTLWNLKLDPTLFNDGDRGFKVVADLLKTFVDKKIWHIQINSVSTDTMRAAQKEPEENRDLMVRVAGYSAFFTELKKPTQDMIISRTEHKVG